MKPNRVSRFLPVEKYQIQTKLTPEEVKERVALITASEYNGIVSGNTFKLSRSIKYQNSFLPEIKGTIASYLGKTEIDISMSLNLYVKIFVIVWLSLTGIPSAIILLALVRMLIHFYFKGFSPFLLIPIGMFIFGYLLMLVAFKSESRISKKRLNVLFEAEPK
ncbi:MAG: hypothetical protein K0S23_2716 [Fluviicola sp.]|jgi:hypothetical protein|uniref:hypothetical protein n=1 Tax=Fluviicola sp. TaxID=1917219 RepID=UPI0026226C1E|nr:hypothetical protein [Fluviicola sp.]MDF3028409.1 hypothetical protein [Fluviicola sp.]